MRRVKECTGKWISVLHRQLHCYLNKELEEINLTTGDYIYIAYLIENGDGISQDCLVKNLYIDKAAVARSVASLEKKGFLIRTEDSVDKRKKRVFLTKEGKALHKPLFNILDEWEEKLSDGKDQKNIKITVDTLQEMSKGILK